MEANKKIDNTIPECLRGGKKITIKRAIVQEDGTLYIPEKSRKKTGVLNTTVTPDEPMKFNRRRGDNKQETYGQVVSSTVQNILEINGSAVIQTKKSFYVVLP